MQDHSNFNASYDTGSNVENRFCRLVAYCALSPRYLQKMISLENSIFSIKSNLLTPETTVEAKWQKTRLKKLDFKRTVFLRYPGRSRDEFFDKNKNSLK